MRLSRIRLPPRVSTAVVCRRRANVLCHAYPAQSPVRALERRQEAWRRLASDLDPGKLAAITSEIDLSGVMEAGRRIVEGGVRGRIIVKIG